MKCAPGNCFRCIRQGTKYDFAYACSYKVLRKMDEEERWELAEEVFKVAKREFEEYGMKLPQKDIDVLGDCLACLYMFGLGIRMRKGKGPRPRYITSNQVKQLLPIVVKAGNKSMRANGVRSILRRKNYKFPKCWLRMNREYDGPRNRT